MKVFSIGGVRSQLISKDEGKWQLVGCRVDGRVMREFYHGEKVCPFLGVSIVEDPEVDF